MADVMAGCAYSIRMARPSARRASRSLPASRTSAVVTASSFRLATRSSKGSRLRSAVLASSRSPASRAARPPTSHVARLRPLLVSPGAHFSSVRWTVDADSRSSLADLCLHRSKATVCGLRSDTRTHGPAPASPGRRCLPIKVSVGLSAAA